MSGLTSQLNKLGLGSKAATVSSSSSSTTTSNTSSSSSTSTAPVQSSLTAALANRPRHKKSISGGNPEHGFDLGRLAPMPTAPGSTGSQTRTLQASKRQQSSSTNSNSKPILISSKSTGGRGKTGREGGPTLAQSAPTVHYVPPPAPSARPRIASFDPPPMALPPSPDTRGPLANVLRQSISKGPSSRAHKKNDAAAAQARQQRSLSMYPSSAPAHNINYMEQLAAAAVGVFPSGSGLAGKQVFEEGEEGEEEEDTPSARQRRQQRQITAAEDHSETSSTTSSHRSEHKSGDEKSEQQPDEISVDSGGAEEPFDSEDSDVEYGVDGEEEVIIRPIERRMSDLSSSLTYSNMMNQADVGLLSKSPTIFSILKQDVAPSGSVLGMLSSSASSTGSSHLTGTAARVGLPPLAGKKSVTSASSSSSTRGIQIASGGKKPKHPGAYMGSPTDDLQFSISLDPNEDSILDQELEEEESTTPAEPIRENEFMNY